MHIICGFGKENKLDPLRKLFLHAQQVILNPTDQIIEFKYYDAFHFSFLPQ